MNVNFIKSATRLEDLPAGKKPHIAFVGRSNVGKSTLLNRLANQKALARVSANPGRTQTINLFEVDRRFYLVDLPGYGFAKIPKAKSEAISEMIGDYLGQTKQLKLVLVMIDARIGPTDLDEDMIRQLQFNLIPFVLIANKADKLKSSEVVKLNKDLERDYPGTTVILNSALTGQGRERIWETIERALRTI